MGTEIKHTDLPTGNLWKLTNAEENHYGLQYRTGLNTVPKPFNPTGKCSEGGMYFFHEPDIIYFLLYCTSSPVYMRKVTLPENARIYKEDHKFKTDRFFLGEREPFFIPADLCLPAVKQNGRALRWVNEQTPEICVAAVQQDAFALRWVKEQTPEICMTAVQHYGRALRWVEEQTPEICMTAVKQYGFALEFVKEKTPEICMTAVQQDGLALEWVEEQTPELCMAAVQQDGLALGLVKEQTPEICMAVVQQDGRALALASFCIFQMMGYGFAISYKVYVLLRTHVY